MTQSTPPEAGIRRARQTFGFTLPAPTPPVVFEGRRRPGTRVQFYGQLHGADSYANVSGVLARNLLERVGNVAICNYLGGQVNDPALAPHAGLDFRAPVGIFMGFPVLAPERFFEHRVRVGVFVCETDQVLPEWVRACNRFDLIVVPSRFCREAFLASGVTTPVMVVPHGLLPDHRPRAGLSPMDRFVFYNSFRHRAAERKGFVELVECFQAAFQGRDDVVLRLRVDGRHWLPRGRGWPDYGGLVEFDDAESMDPADAAAVYSQVHCTVHPSKGEGFGLVPLESIACGTPVIAPHHTGMADYLDEDNAILLRPGQLIRAPRVHHLCGRYHAVDREHLIELLRHAPAHRDEEQDRVRQAGERIRAEYPWARVLEPFIDMVERLADCTGSHAVDELTSGLLAPGELARHHEEAGRRARAAAPAADSGERGEALRFSSIVYCGWDYPRDGVGNHLRLLDGLVFNGPEIRYKSLDELPGAPYDPEALPVLYSYAHEQRPDLFRGCLYVDVVGFYGDRPSIDAQVERVRDMKRRFGAATAIYLMWESDRLWPPVLELVRAYDIVIVTSNLLADEFARHGVRFAVLPHPYEYAIRRPGPPPPANDDPLTLGVSAGLWPRKNVGALVQAFGETLGGDPAFRLRVHSRVVPREAAARAEYRRIQQATRDWGNVELTVQSFSRRAYLDWMQSLDCYCFVSSGEAWSVTPREALHLGKPVILLDAHVHAGFSHLPGVMAVPPGPRQPARPGAGFLDGNIGFEAGLDPAALKMLFRDLRRRHGEAAAALAQRFDEIPAFHDPGRFRDRWLRVLNQLID